MPMPLPMPRNSSGPSRNHHRSEKAVAVGGKGPFASVRKEKKKKKATPWLRNRSGRNLLALWTVSVLALYGIVAGMWWWKWPSLSSYHHPLRPRHLLLEEAEDREKEAEIAEAPLSPGQSAAVVASSQTTTGLEREQEGALEYEAELVERASRPFGYLPDPLPCLESEKRWFGPSVQRTPATSGLLFVKPYKTASSTAAGIHLRIAWHLLRTTRRRAREGNETLSSSGNRHAKKLERGGDPGGKFEICRSRFDHSIASRMRYGSRHRHGGSNESKNGSASSISSSSLQSSFLWSIVRDPTDRAVSQFYHFAVGRHGVEATDDAFRHALSRPSLSNYYLRTLALNESEYRWLSSLPLSSFSTKNRQVSRSLSRHGDPVEAEAFQRILDSILSGYDFLAVTERIDESLVAMQMLSRNQISLASILYLDAKRGGGYDDGGGKKSCVRIPQRPSYNNSGRLTPAMQEYLRSPEWTSRIYWDQLLHRVANRSLDRTIDETIGRDAFERQLGRFQAARRVAVDKCASRAVFPCDEQGGFHNATDCIWNDSGTYECWVLLPSRRGAPSK
jgi:hypothetical protein